MTVDLFYLGALGITILLSFDICQHTGQSSAAYLHFFLISWLPTFLTVGSYFSGATIFISFYVLVIPLLPPILNTSSSHRLRRFGSSAPIFPQLLFYTLPCVTLFPITFFYPWIECRILCSPHFHYFQINVTGAIMLTFRIAQFT